jgi:hypothetical protein
MKGAQGGRAVISRKPDIEQDEETLNMDEILWVFMVLDPWRILLPLGLSMVLVGTRWFEKVRHQPPNVVFHEALTSLSIRSAFWLFGLTGFGGVLFSWFAGFQANAGGLGYLEGLIFLSGIGCLWEHHRRRNHQTSRQEILLHGACLMFWSAAFVWVLKWDILVNLPRSAREFPSILAGGWEWSRIVSKFIHLWLASFAAAGLIIILLGLRNSFWRRLAPGHQAEDSDEERLKTTRFGIGWVLAGVVPQVVIGSWLLVELGEGVRELFLGGLNLSSVLFFVGLLTGLFGLVLLNAAFIAPQVNGLVWGGWGNVLVSLVFMGLVRYESMRVTVLALEEGVVWAPLGQWSVALGTVTVVGMGALLIPGNWKFPFALIDKSTS